MDIIKQHRHFLFSGLFALCLCANIHAEMAREEIADNYKWNLQDIYASDDEWTQAKDALIEKLPVVEAFKGTLTTSAENLLKCLSWTSDLQKEATKLYIYASMASDLDTRVMKYAGMKKELQQIFSDFGARSAFINPEILTVDWATIESFISEESKLEDYRMMLDDLFRQKAHTLSEQEERIMALAGNVTGVAASTYNTFSNAEMPKPVVTLADGSKVSVGKAEYAKYRASANRDDRTTVFEAFWKGFADYKGTLGEMLYGNVKAHLFSSKARHYESALDAALYSNNIPTDVYYSLVKGVNENLDAFHRYLKIKQRLMGVEKLSYIDLYAPAVADVDLQYTFDEATKIVLEALKPLGEDYVSVVKQALDNRWIDVYPTTGKRSGGYSNGAFYDGHPFILLNYNDMYEDLSTLAHELGHTMQSYLSNKNQPYPLSDYTIFVAEVASTFNEVLLFNYILDTVDNDDVKLSILMNCLDGFKGTLFRQTQFAEFELKIHEAAQSGQALTGDTFSEIYRDIVRRYYGHDEGICEVPDYIDMEWAYIPHFYYNFYVYQYSTSFTASNSLAEKVMSGDKEALDRYINFLSAGSSEYSIDLLKNAGVDMTSTEPLEGTIQAMNKIMDKIEEILNKRNM